MKKLLSKMTVTLKTRMRILLIASSIIPLLLIWFFTDFQVYELYQKNTDAIIQNELAQMEININTPMSNMKYVSQQLVIDENLTHKLRDFFVAKDEVRRVNALKFLQEQIAVYEVSNPNIGNITFFYEENDVVQKLNATSLAQSYMPLPQTLLSTQSHISYYGPHKTASVVGDYPVISLVRKLSFPDTPDLYLYIESGYKQMGKFAAQTLDQLAAVYTIVSEDGNVVYSSNEALLPTFSEIIEYQGERPVIRGEEFRPYRVTTEQDWSLQVFVPCSAYQQYIHDMNMGFFIVIVFTVGLAIIVGGLIWNSVNRPWRLFQENLDKFINDDSGSDIRAIHVKELDQNFIYMNKMKSQITSLIQEAQLQEREKAQLEIKTFLSKINPHFLHNTLDTLKWYSAQKGYSDVESFVTSLNGLLMYNMEKNKITTLESELLAVDDYVAVQKLKYDLDYHKEINLPKPMLQTEMPRFILQPLVENAIFHGLEGRGNVCIRIGLRQSGKIYIQVINDGYPMNVKRMEGIIQSAKDLSSNGIGIQYVIRSLEATFPNTYGFQVMVQNGENCIEIELPFSKGDYYAKDVDC